MILIAGPCSAESEGQVCSVAKSLAPIGLSWFRAGLWKPRTHPGSFEGVGAEGIPWLVRVKEEFGLGVATEVACPAHAEACLNAGLTAFWIGARTVSNPFLVDELALSLKGSGATVMVKNPMSPDVELWAGAVERFQRAGIVDIILIHRGFTPVLPIQYRNNPQWGVALSMRARFPQLRMICDPSHIAGECRFVGEIAQKAMDIGMDGLMVEVHDNPSCALSDAAQQLDPSAFAAFLSGLSLRCSDSSNASFNRELSQLRAEIDSLDSTICTALAARMRLSRRIGQLKRSEGVSILQQDRWQEILREIDSCSSAESLDPTYLRRIFDIIHEESVKEQ